MRAILGAIAAYALLVGILFSPVLGDDYDAFYRSFVPVECCFTSRCCFEISEDDVDDLGYGSTEHGITKQKITGHLYRIKASGQIVARTGFSPDGKTHRCSCEHDGNSWVKFPTANTRCLFTPPFGS
jgi:hypothetical protein